LTDIRQLSITVSIA